ncbi:RNA 2'-phosphotransferase [Peptoniphilus asaccharolyticus]
MNYSNLSKEVSYALRHAPWEYELELDSEGWVSVEQLISSFRNNEEWQGLTEEGLVNMISLSEKKRHEIKNGKIRAFYGHSVPMKISKEIGIPPKYLYHGTSITFLPEIKSNGLKPMSRQYVHLSEDIDTARLVGKRKKGDTVILVIDTELARSKCVKFYVGNDKVWLSDYIPPEFIKES